MLAKLLLPMATFYTDYGGRTPRSKITEKYPFSLKSFTKSTCMLKTKG